MFVVKSSRQLLRTRTAIDNSSCDKVSSTSCTTTTTTPIHGRPLYTQRHLGNKLLQHLFFFNFYLARRLRPTTLTATLWSAAAIGRFRRVFRWALPQNQNGRTNVVLHKAICKVVLHECICRGGVARGYSQRWCSTRLFAYVVLHEVIRIRGVATSVFAEVVLPRVHLQRCRRTSRAVCKIKVLHEFTSCKVVFAITTVGPSPDTTPHLVQWQGMPMCLTSLEAFTEPSFTRSMNIRSAFMYAFTTYSRRR